MDYDRHRLNELDGPALARAIANKVRGSGNLFGLSFTSRGKKYTFYWHQKGQCLRVKVQRLPAYCVRPNIEALARALLATRVCPLCAAAFPRHGKQKFCTPRHATQYRKRRWLKRHGKLWSPEHLSPEATARRELARDAAERQDDNRQRAARFEQQRMHRLGRSRLDRED